MAIGVASGILDQDCQLIELILFVWSMICVMKHMECIIEAVTRKC